MSCTPGPHGETHTSRGTGKSPTLDPLRSVLENVLRKTVCGPGRASDNFHVQQGTTHAAAFSRSLETGGYLFIASAEAGPLLCPSFASLGRWDRCPVRWETMEHRKGKVPKSNKDEADLSSHHAPTQRMSTNVQIGMLQQVVMFAKWWALVENNEPVGLAPRFLLSFVSAGEPGDYRLTEFSRCVALPFMENGKSSRSLEAFLIRTSHFFGDSDRQTAIFFTNLRRVAALLSSDSTYGTLLRSAVNKAVYWVGSVALQCMLLATIIPLLSHKVGPPDHVFSTKTLTRDALVAGTRFFWCRSAFGIAVLQRDIIEKAWQTIDLPLDLDFVRSDRHCIGSMLRRTSGITITFHFAECS